MNKEFLISLLPLHLEKIHQLIVSQQDFITRINMTFYRIQKKLHVKREMKYSKHFRMHTKNYAHWKTYFKIIKIMLHRYRDIAYSLISITNIK